jgi:formamidopyrimidine-DNA glycosylase
VPELPEVETVRRQLEPLVVGRRVVDACAFASPKFTAATRALGATITAVGRRGKYLLVALGDASPGGPPGRELVVHLGMTGTLRPRTGAGDPFVRAWWAFDDGSALEYRDVRRFGRLAVVPAHDYRTIPTLHALGPEPLSDDFDPAAFHAVLRRSRRRVKTQLLSQRPVAGVGNIYADEALWRAGVHPGARTISRPRAMRLHGAIRDVLAAGLANGGTTLRDYRTPGGDEGANQHHLDCYGRAGEPCRRCATTLRRTVIDQRGTTFCPACQRR